MTISTISRPNHVMNIAPSERHGVLRTAPAPSTYDAIIQAVMGAQRSVWIATANLKELMVEDPRAKPGQCRTIDERSRRGSTTFGRAALAPLASFAGCAPSLLIRTGRRHPWCEMIVAGSTLGHREVDNCGKLTECRFATSKGMGVGNSSSISTDTASAS